MSRLIIHILLIGIMLLLTVQRLLGASAMPTHSGLQHINETSLPVLLDKAHGFYENHPDSAIFYYTAVVNRYSPSLKDNEKEICLTAALSIWELVFFNYFDYSSAFESLTKAKEISNDMKRDEPRINLYYGCMYHTVFEQTGDYETGEKSFDYFSKAFDKAIEKQDMMVSRMAFGNLSEVAGSLNKLDDIKDRVARYRNTAELKQWEGREFDLGLYEAQCLESTGDYKQSAKVYQRLGELAEKPGLERYRYAALQGLITSNIRTGRFKDALSLIHHADTLFNTDNMRDGRLMLHNMRAICYDSLGNYDMARQSMAEYVMLKDSLLNYNKATAIKSIEFVDELCEFDRQLTESRQKRQRQMITLVMVILILLFVCGAWLKLRRKNKALESANQSLYRKNQELLHLEADAVRIREVAAKTIMVDKNNSDLLQKYKGSTVTDDMRESLWLSIMDTLDHSPEIYDADFSLERLAELCGSKAKYVSQVINEKGDNFKTLINTRRIHQACRSMSESSNLTIEAIANNVGFRSPNAFRTSFKRVTGLSPSQYLQMAKKQEVNNHE